MRVLFVFVMMALPLAAFPVPKPSRTPSMADTVWVANDKGEVFTIFFRADGTLTHSGASTADGAWKQDGARVTWHVNNYSFYEANFAGESLHVKARNIEKWKSEFKLEMKK